MNKRTNIGRGLSLLLALLLTLSAFAGCSDGGNSSSQASSQASAAVSAPDSSAPQSSDAASSEVSGSTAVSTKTITLEVVHKDGSKKDFTIETEAENLRAALEQEKLIEGEESSYGLFVKTVDGETVDEDNQEWWCLTKDGEMTETGVDDTKIADGDAYVFTLTVGY